MKNVFASLVYDSWTEPVPELRATPLQNRHLIFEGEGLILDLLFRKSGDGACIHIGGQVLPRDSALDSVSDVQVLMEHGSDRSSTHTNALGEFAFHTVPNGPFDLEITLKNRRFVVKGLSNTEPRMWSVTPMSAAKGWQ